MTREPSYVDVQAAKLNQAVRDAVASSDLTEVHRLLDHMTAEGPTGITKDWLLAVALFRLSLEANGQGKPELAAQYHQMAITECGTEAMHFVIVTSLLDVGRKRGWLYAEEYDRVAELAEAEFPELVSKLHRLERRER